MRVCARLSTFDQRTPGAGARVPLAHAHTPVAHNTSAWCALVEDGQTRTNTHKHTRECCKVRVCHCASVPTTAHRSVGPGPTASGAICRRFDQMGAGAQLSPSCRRCCHGGHYRTTSMICPWYVVSWPVPPSDTLLFVLRLGPILDALSRMVLYRQRGLCLKCKYYVMENESPKEPL